MKHRFFIICMSVLLALTLCGCNSDYMNEVKEFAMIADHDDLSALEQYPNLEYVDLRGSTCYDAIGKGWFEPDIFIISYCELFVKHFDRINLTGC